MKRKVSKASAVALVFEFEDVHHSLKEMTTHQYPTNILGDAAARQSGVYACSLLTRLINTNIPTTSAAKAARMKFFRAVCVLYKMNTV